MTASFTEFKLNIGIKNDDRDTEYSSILRGLVKELYSTYGIALSKDVDRNIETINTTFNTKVELAYKNIVSLVIAGKTENVDYTLDKINGSLTLLSSGTMLEGTDYEVSYSYYVFINESNSLEHLIYPEVGVKTYHIDVKPYKVLGVTYNDSDLVKDLDYYEYNNTFEVAITPTSNRNPYKLNMEIGYTEIPADLKQAFYDLAQIRFDMKDKKTYLISRVSDNSQGNSTTYRLDSTPDHIKAIFEHYMGRRYFI